MKILIVYDSIYGNTEKIAQAIQETIIKLHEVHIKKAKNATLEDLRGIDFLIVGSPTHGGRASRNTKRFLCRIANGSLTKVKAAAFDTGIPVEGQNCFIRFVIRFFGYASGNIAKMLVKKDAKIISTETFFVLGKEGPLAEGEIKRAGKWAEQILNTKLKIIV